LRCPYKNATCGSGKTYSGRDGGNLEKQAPGLSEQESVILTLSMADAKAIVPGKVGLQANKYIPARSVSGDFKSQTALSQAIIVI